jgi:hypothetical protein
VASNHLTTEQRSVHNTRAIRKRWEHDQAGLERHVDQVVKRAPALTADQRDRLATILRVGVK